MAAAPGTPVSVNGTADSVLRATTGYVYAITISETAGAAAVLKLRAVSATGQIVIPIRLAALGTVTASFPAGILFDRGVYEDWVSGAYEGTVTIG